MSSRTVISAVLMLVMACVGSGCSSKFPDVPIQVEEAAKNTLKVTISSDTQEIIEKSLKKTQKPLNWSDQTKGIIVPHHLLQADLIAQSFGGLNNLAPQVVVLLSPNHKKNIDHGIITVNKDLLTYKGLMPVSAVTSELIDSDLAVNDPQVLLVEYGLSNLFPYIQEMNWNAELIPLVTSRGLTEETLEKIVETIEKRTEGKRVLWIASIDFSHGLQALESRMRDEDTLDWMEKRDISSILSSGPEHMDNPSGLVLWLKAIKSIERVYHGESGSRSEATLGEAGTSYMIFEGQ